MCSCVSVCGNLLHVQYLEFSLQSLGYLKTVGLYTESFVAQEVTILLTSQRTTVFLPPPLSPRSVCYEKQQRSDEKMGQNEVVP